MLLSLSAIFIAGPGVAPKLSNSISFNQKATWLRGTQSCDVLILGSSMALNNLDGPRLRQSVPGLSVVNAGSWGMSAKESKRVLESMVRVCSPRFVIFPVYNGDLFAKLGSKSENAKHIDWPWFGKYLAGVDGPLDWIRGVDPIYSLRTYGTLKSEPYLSPSFYTSLAFDNTGGVLFSEDHFKIDKGRWNGYVASSRENADDDQIEALFGVVDEAIEHRAVAVIVRVPMIKAAETAFAQNRSSANWNSIELGVVERGGLFVDATSLRLPDQRFVDYCHLDAAGASAVTNLVIQRIMSLTPFTRSLINAGSPVKGNADQAFDSARGHGAETDTASTSCRAGRPTE